MTFDTINDAQTIAGSGEGTLLANRYRVVRQLGQGGMGSVWLAEDTQLDSKPFAIKMLPAILVANKRAYRQLKDEALVAMRLVHPNIVQIRAFEENNGNPFLVMDYIDGQTLDDYLAEHFPADATLADVARPPRPCCKGEGALATSPGAPRPPQCGLPEADVLRILRPIAAALDYAHGEGVVHRDVKPANVMIRKDGHPFVLDFGIAREIQETLTRVTGKLSSGTLLYMSPEQLMGEQPKPAQDVYSFAAMVYECLKGEPPFVRGAIEDQIKNKQPESPPGGTQLVASVMSGLSKKPEDRPPTCSAVLEGKAFSRVEHVERVDDAGGSRSRATAKILLAATALALAAAGGWWYYRQEQVREQARIAVEAARQKAAAEDAKRKAEEAARPKAAAEDAKRKAEEAVRLAAERREAAEIRIEAKVSQAKVIRLSDADGFKMRKDSLEETFTRAEALFDEKVKRWAEAAQGFSNYVMRAGDLVRLDGERQSASKSRTQAQEAFRFAEAAGAKTYAMTRWNAAVEIWNRADAEFGRMEFSAAGGTFASAAKQFETCIGEAKNEKERREAEARDRAEREAREREAAERRRQEAEAAKARAEKEARERREAEERAAMAYSNRPKDGDTKTFILPGGVKMEMVYVAPGTFTMGSPTSENGRRDDEAPHQVSITKPYWIGKYPVTQSQWKALARANDVSFSKGAPTPFFSRDGKGSEMVSGMDTSDFPMDNISWEDCNTLVKALNRNATEERTYSLPTEAQWEFAAKGGKASRGYTYSGGDDMDQFGWYYENSGLRRLSEHYWKFDNLVSNRCRTHSVTEKNVGNELGIVGMSGNVSELCNDWYAMNYYSSSPTEDPQGPVAGDLRVVRGGAFESRASGCRSANRGRWRPGRRASFIGFRLACSAGPRE